MYVMIQNGQLYAFAEGGDGSFSQIILTAANSNGYTTTQSSYVGTNLFWKSFTGNSADFWQSKGSSIGEQIMGYLTCPNAIRLTGVTIADPPSGRTYLPQGVQWQALSDSGTWKVLGTLTRNSSNNGWACTITDTGSYISHRLRIQTYASTTAQIGQIKVSGRAKDIVFRGVM